MGNPGEHRRRPKVGVDQVLALHRELNPVPGRPLLVAIDQASGQLFFCAAKGSCLARDRSASVQRGNV
jgi:hypothetical protein